MAPEDEVEVRSARPKITLPTASVVESLVLVSDLYMEPTQP